MSTSARILYLCFASFILFFFSGCDAGRTNSEALSEDIHAKGDTIIANISEPVIPADTIYLNKYAGFEPDFEGTRDFSGAINKAIEELSERGGGTIYFAHPKGKNAWRKTRVTYRCDGPIELHSNISLAIEPHIRFFFPFNYEAYNNGGEGVLTRYEGTTAYGLSPLVRGFNVKNVSIVRAGGSGAAPVFDGDGERWVHWMLNGDYNSTNSSNMKSHVKIRNMNNEDVPVRDRKVAVPGEWFLRPPLFQFMLSEQILLEGIKVTNSPFWCVHFVFSENITARYIEFDAHNINNDGFDPESSRNVLIENVYFNNRDDNVAVKAGRDKEGRDGAIVAGTELENIESYYINNGRIGGPSENIVVRNCVFKGHHALAMGSEMSGGVRNVVAVDNISNQNVRMAVYLKSSRRRGGVIENIYVDNWDMGIVNDDLIGMVPNYDGDTESPHVPQFRHITINDIHAKRAGNGIRIYGWPEKPAKAIAINNVTIDEIEKEPVVIVQVENVTLSDVKIGGESYDGTYTETDSSVLPPKQK